MSDTIHIEDLWHPTFSPEVNEMLAGMAVLADECPLDAGRLHRQAAEETGLTDFGPRDYEERLGVLLEALGEVERVTPAGQVVFYSQVLQLLRNRLLFTDLLTRHPQIHGVELTPPIVIVGLPRTGTTHLHNMLATDPALRSLPYWESLEPIPMPAEVGVVPDPRRQRTDAGLWFLNQAMPLFPLMHEMTTDHVHEEIQLLAIDFSTMFFETLAPLPNWEAYYSTHDQTPHYRFLRTMLQALQFTRGGDRWVLKSPQHLEQLPVLAEVFPGATVVVTHRDPVDVVVSMATMVAYTARMYTDEVDAEKLGRTWADRIDDLLTACLRDREVWPAERSVDVRFDDFMADQLTTVRSIYELAGQPFDAAARVAMEAYLAEHRRGRLGSIDYRAGQVGLDREDLRKRFAPYVERFL
ncbi:MAG TPA: sulfotransferase [Acidimicrobiales bacterium]|nr:sulfotransferase [Acidimicrobiales bacterium]